MSAVAEVDPGTVTPPPIRPTGIELWEAVVLDIGAGSSATFVGVSWDEYERLLAVRGESRPGVQLVYHAGSLTIMTVGIPHERWKTILLGLLDQYLIAADIPAIPCGNMTIRRRDLASGLEPDGCYFIRPPATLLAVRQYDFATDPPPDLAVEVEASRSATGKLPVLAALKVSEVWRFDGTTVKVLRLQPAGDYRPAPASVLLPSFPVADIPRYLQLAETVFYPQLLARFLAEVRATLPPPETA